VPATPLHNTNDSIQTPSLFEGHTLVPATNFVRSERERGFDGFFSIILILSFILFVIVKVFSPRKFRQMLGAFIKPSAMNQLLREEYAFSNRSSILLLSLFLLVFPLFILQTTSFFLQKTFTGGSNHIQTIPAYLLLLTFVLATYSLKISSIRFISSAVGLRASGAEYIYTILLFNKIAGLFIFPLVLLIAFARQLNAGYFLDLGLMILAILLIYRMLRLIQIGISSAGVSGLYLFLYLCTLEILPLVVLIKLFIFSFL
jgi:hypothetical protein